MPRHDDRAIDQLRPVRIQRGFVKTAAASVLIEAGNTMVLCTASLERTLPPWRKPRKEGDVPLGWVTAEYNMLPGSTTPRKQRDRNKVDGRTTEIQRLIGRCLRAVVDFAALGENTITIDCDVLQADGGTRTASITGGFIALADVIHQLALPRPVLLDTVAAISVGVVNVQNATMKGHWEAEKEAITAIRTLKEELEQLRNQVERESDLNLAAEIRYGRNRLVR